MKKKGEAVSLTKNFSVKIVGVSYQEGYPQNIHDLPTGAPAILTAEPNNKFDPNAVKVTTVDNKQIGYVPASVAKKLSMSLAAGNNYSAVFKKHISPDHTDRPGVTVMVANEPAIK